VKRARPPVPHPLDLALRARFAREAGLDPDELTAWMEWRKPAPPIVVEGLVAAFDPLVPPDSFLFANTRLTSNSDNSTIRTMRTERIDEPKIGRPFKLSHRLIDELAARNISLAEEARAVKRTPTSLRNMMYPKGHPSNRPVPRQLQKRWETLYGVPESDWARVVD
jgi:hypothetical protein